jgi:hypothetical protein
VPVARCDGSVERTRVNIRNDVALSNSDISQELFQLFVVADGELEVSRSNAGPRVLHSTCCKP